MIPQLEVTPAEVCKLQSCFEDLKLMNDANLCFVNATFLAVLWATLSSSGFNLAHWGPCAGELISFLHHANRDTAHDLRQIPCFQWLLQRWSHADLQGDSAEFLAFMLTGLKFTGFSFSWERRVQIGVTFEVADQNDVFDPIVLQFDPEQLHDDHAMLNQLVADWHNQNGMKVALIESTPLICLQIDRHVRSGDGRVQKSAIPIHVHGLCDIPFFIDDSLDVEWKSYCVVAMNTHLGTDAAGHCQAVLKVEPTLATPSNHQIRYTSMITDDWSLPKKTWKEPTWVASNLSYLWLCALPQARLYHLTTPDPNDAQETGTGLHVRGPPNVPSDELLNMFDDD